MGQFTFFQLLILNAVNILILIAFNIIMEISSTYCTNTFLKPGFYLEISFVICLPPTGKILKYNILVSSKTVIELFPYPISKITFLLKSLNKEL